jgi:hypothetical protein
MSLAMLAEIVCGVAVIPIVLWFYPHCARPGLTWARARRPAFIAAQVGTLAGVLTGLIYILDPLGLLPRGSFVAALVLLVVWLPAPLAFLRPIWIVRATGGPSGA